MAESSQNNEPKVIPDQFVQQEGLHKLCVRHFNRTPFGWMKFAADVVRLYSPFLWELRKLREENERLRSKIKEIQQGELFG